MDGNIEHCRVLFVCLGIKLYQIGNICRSPIAEAVFADLVQRQGLSSKFIIDSAATSTYEIGNPADERAVSVCTENGLKSIQSKRARQIKASDFGSFDLILCMDEENYKTLKQMQPPGTCSKVCMFGLFSDCNHQLDLVQNRDLLQSFPSNSDAEMAIKIVHDPYYGSIADFNRVFEQCIEYSSNLLQFLKKTRAI
jgi:low molecular weight phosphotyrosine protein phosphatase